jgi:hypothetical protein
MNVHRKGEFKNELVNIIHLAFGMTLICNSNSLTLSWNLVNVFISTVLDTLHFLGAKIC